MDENNFINKIVNDPNSILEDPVIKKSLKDDPTLKDTINNNPTIFDLQKKLLIEKGDKPDIFGNDTNDEALYYQYLDGSLNEELYNQYLKEKIDNPNLQAKGYFTSDKFWLENPNVLFENQNYTRIIPTKSMSRNESLNSLTRFFLYILVLFLLFSKKKDFLYIPIICIILIIVLYYIQKNDTNESKRQKICRPDKCNKIELCKLPTKDNPFMNVTMNDLIDDKDRPKACSMNDKNVVKKADEYFYNNLFIDSNDLFGRNTAQRQFYTTPSTTIPNDQTGFANFLYGTPSTCKENQSNCLKYEDLRYSRFNPIVDRNHGIGV